LIGVNPKEKLVVLPAETYLSLRNWLFLLDDSLRSSGLGTTLLTKLVWISSPTSLFSSSNGFFI